MRILVVDDEPLILNGLKKIIKRHCPEVIQVDGACDGIEAMKYVKKWPPDLLITDINMPEMNGLELIKNIKESYKCNRFIVLTGYDDFHYVRQALRYQVIDYLLKPINKDEVIEIICKMSTELLTAKKAVKKENYFVEINENILTQHIKETILFIHHYYKEDLSLDMVAEYVGLHRNYLSSLFKKETGVTFLQYVHTYRISLAKELLIINPQIPVTQIAIAVGYENLEHFYKLFRRYVGVTPKWYRQKNNTD